MTDMHAKAVEAACLAEHGEYWSTVSAANQFVYRARMARNIARFLRTVTVSRPNYTRDECRAIAHWLGEVADELDGGRT